MKKHSLPILDPIEIGRALRGNVTSSKKSTGWGGPSIDPNSPKQQSTPNLHCTRCDVNTAGTPKAGNDDERRCPSCSSLLMYCPSCHSLASATEKFNVLTCDRCHADYVVPSTIEYLISRDRQAREIVLSGIRATGEIHMGNYLGAVRRFVEFQNNENLCLFFIADWHSLTDYSEVEKIDGNLVAIAMDYIAAGLNPERSIVYAQSSVPEIAELSLYLSMCQSKTELENMPTIREKIEKLAEQKENEKNNVANTDKKVDSINLGLLSYPVLMAADILGPKATLVPVGADQVTNVELARSLARKFNNKFGTSFIIPRSTEGNIKVPGLKGGKMGKSEDGERISPRDSLEELTQKYLKHGVTDPARVRRSMPGNPANCVSVFPMYKILRGEDVEFTKIVEGGCTGGSRSCVECKTELAREIDKVIAPFRDARAKIDSQTKYVAEVLHYGAIKAREIIRPTLEEVREKMGIATR